MNTAYQIALTAAGISGISAILSVFFIALTDQFDVNETAVGAGITIGFIAAIVGFVSAIVGVWI